MKYIVSTVLFAASLVSAAPHRHVGNGETLTLKGAMGIMTDASQDGRECLDQMVDCYTVAYYDTQVAALNCQWPKIARFNNDASCHACPSLSCQYIFGNEFGNYVPCRNADGETYKSRDSEGDDTISTLNVQDVDGNGLALFDPILGTTYQDPTTNAPVKFCDTDSVALNKFNAALPLDACGPWRAATIVSPATCHHCQKIRCMPVWKTYRYKTFMNSPDLIANNMNLDYIGTGIATLDDHLDPQTAKFHCGYYNTVSARYNIIYSFCVKGDAYVADTLNGDTDATCSTLNAVECPDPADCTMVTSDNIPTLSPAVSSWLSGAFGALTASDAGCESVGTFTGLNVYILAITANSESFLIVG